MGHALAPGPANELGYTIVLDEGTSARTESPPPGTIGLDAKGGTPTQDSSSIADQIAGYARRRRGGRVGDGECFTLADRALRSAGARSAADYGTVTPDADYVWGTHVSLSDVRPGDIVQFRGYRFDRETETRNADGSVTTTTEYQERPHHTAIIERVDPDGALTVLEQNSPAGAPVSRMQLFFSDSTTRRANRTTTVTVRGTVWFYRPQPQ